MEKHTLLEMTQQVAISLDYETVNSISDTPESEKIATIIRGEYSKFMDAIDWPHLKVVAELVGLSDVTRPNFMQLPALVAMIDTIRYDVTDTGDTNNEMKTITFYEDSNDFLDKIYSRNTGNSNVTVFDTSEGIPIWTITDEHPTFCTTFDDDILVFDAYKSTEDTTLQASKSLVRGLRGSAWTVDDSFTPLMPVNMFSTFISKCKVVANEQLRQVALRSEADDHRTAMNRQKRNQRITNAVTRPNYGRGS